MLKAAKGAVVEQLKAQVAACDGIILVDYKGLTVAALSRLRTELKPMGVKIQVLKNRLFTLATQGTAAEAIGAGLEETTAALFVKGEVPEVARAMEKFVKDFPQLKLKRALFEGEYIDEKRVDVLPKLPTRKDLASSLVGTLAGPINGLVRSLNYPMVELVNTLSQIKEKQEAA